MHFCIETQLTARFQVLSVGVHLFGQCGSGHLAVGAAQSRQEVASERRTVEFDGDQRGGHAGNQ